MQIVPASRADLDGIRALLKAKHVDNVRPQDRADGFVTTDITDEQLERLIVQEHGVTIAREEGRVLAFAFAADWAFWKEWPLFVYMMEKLPEFSFHGQVLTVENTYQYGPVCLDRTIRGSGVFERVFFASLATMRGRYPIMTTFINQVNGRSWAAHTRKAHMTRCGSFTFRRNVYDLMACSTSQQP